MIKEEHFKTLIDFEAYGGAIKGRVVRIGQDFRLKRPDHEFTRMFDDIEEYVYASHIQIIKLMRENKTLKDQINEMNDNSVELEFEKHLEKVVTDTEYSRTQFQSKKFNEEEAPF